MKLTLSLLALAGVCLAQTPPKKTLPLQTPAPTIQVRALAEKPPLYKTRYWTKLLSKQMLTLTLECQDSPYGGDRTCTAILMQPDEKEARFYVGGIFGGPAESVADQVLDPVIVPEVKKVVAEMYGADVRWRRSAPEKFYDEQGNHWVRETGK